MKALLKGQLKSMQEAVRGSRGCLTRCNYIVTVEDQVFDFDVDVDGAVTGAGPRLPHNCRRFGKVDAEMVAGKVENGNGVKGKAEGWVEVTERHIRQLQELIEDLEAGLNV